VFYFTRNHGAYGKPRQLAMETKPSPRRAVFCFKTASIQGNCLKDYIPDCAAGEIRREKISCKK